MDSIVVAGGAGFIGSNFVHHALDVTKARIIVVDKLTYAGNLDNIKDALGNERVTFIKADISDRVLVDDIFRTYQPDAIVNFAAESHVDRSIDDPSPFINANIVGVFTLLEASRKMIASLSSVSEKRSSFRFLQISTDEVYGTLGKTGFFSEDTPYAPNSPYAASKASADHLVRAYAETYGLPTLITNCSNNYGPYQFPEKLIPLIIMNAVLGKKLPIYGDGKNVRDWLYVEDHCNGILTVLQHGGIGEKYNIGGGNERTNIQIVDSICDEIEKLYPASENPTLVTQGISSYKELKSFVTDRLGHDRRYAIDATKIRRELGWSPKYDFDNGIAKTVEWYLKQFQVSSFKIRNHDF